jgi:hypothetical protein
LRRSWAAQREPAHIRDRPADARGQLSRWRHLSIEFTDDAPDDEQQRLGAWLELRAGDQLPYSRQRPAPG